jgi:hypothetical protein
MLVQAVVTLQHQVVLTELILCYGELKKFWYLIKFKTQCFGTVEAPSSEFTPTRAVVPVEYILLRSNSEAAKDM